MPEDWNADEWRAYLKRRGVKVAAALTKARDLAREAGQPSPATLDEVVGIGIGDDLAGWVEEQAT